MDYIKPYLDFLGAHPDLALAIVFLIALGEALLVIGLFVPSTAVLVGAGILVGTGSLQFWPIFIATTLGCIAGDQISFWAGRIFGERLKLIWPLSRYPQLVAKGEDFVREHGGKSIAIGRFVPGVKAVIPGIVGMLGMGQVFFAVINIVSGTAWAAMHIFPGILIGQGLAFAGELSGRLVSMLLLLLAIVGVGGYLIRLIAAGASPYLWHAAERFSAWTEGSRSPWLRRLGSIAHPDSPRAALLVAFVAIVLLGVLALTAMILRYAGSASVSNADVSLLNLMKEMRSAPGDDMMVVLSMLSDGVVLVPLAVTMFAWLVWRRSYRAAVAVGLAFVCGRVFVWLLSLASVRTLPSDLTNGPTLFSFAAGHITMATLTFGMLAVLASHSLARWSRSVVYASSGVLVLAMAFARVYLGLNWLSDVLSGLVFGTVLAALFGLVIETIPPRRVLPLGLLAAGLVVFAIAGSVHMSWGFDRALANYAPRQRMTSINFATWENSGWKTLPKRRIDFVGKTGETFLIQYAGSLDSLRLSLAPLHWTEVPRWSWARAVAYLNPGASLADLPPRPTLHEGLKAKLTLVRPLGPNERQVLRIYKTDRLILNRDHRPALYLVSLTRETINKGFGIYALPRLVVAHYDERTAVLAEIAKVPDDWLWPLAQAQVNKLPYGLLMGAP